MGAPTSIPATPRIDLVKTVTAGLLAWLTWLSVTLIDIQQEVTADSERVTQLESSVDDHEQRLRRLEQHPP